MDPKSVADYVKSLCRDLDAGRTPRRYDLRRAMAPIAVPAALGLAVGMSGCLEPVEPDPIPETETSCSDGIDNDLDGLFDCDDTVDCELDLACAAVALYAVQPPPTDEEVDCTDRLDNDEDGWIDCDDSDCFEDPACGVVALYAVPAPEMDCDDGIDNDRDGEVDCDDYNCDGDPVCESSPTED